MERECIYCKCRDSEPCPAGCSWVFVGRHFGLCSECVMLGQLDLEAEVFRQWLDDAQLRWLDMEIGQGVLMPVPGAGV